MNPLTLISGAIFLGVGATLTFDAWGLFLKYAFKLVPSNICLVGRWLLHMPRGIFVHSSIVQSPPMRAECAVGWAAHYLIGITFAGTWLVLAGQSWLEQPTLLPAMLFGVVTVAAPLFIMQPSFGFGIAASKTANPMQARSRTLMNHLAFGLGLYIFAALFSWLSGIVA